MRLIFLLFLSFIYDIRSEEINDEIDNGHLSTGAILRKQEGYAQTSSNGGTIAFFRSKPRIAAVRTFSEGYVGGDRTPHLRETIHDGNYDHDLHTAYRLPLQRLSDQQLSMILKKHSPEIRDGGTHMTRVEMINEVQEKIVQKSTKKLMRPTLLTNINVLPEEITIDNEPVENPKTHQRTTVASIISATDAPEHPEIVKSKKYKVRRSQKNIPELETEEQHPNVKHYQSERLRKLSTKLRYVKARYNAMKVEYLQRLRQINERKISLAIKTIPVDPSVIAKEINDEPKKIISTVLIDNEPSNSQESVSTPVKIIPSKSKKIITTAVKTLIDNEPESAEITSTHVTPLIDNEPVEFETEATTQTSTSTSRNDWEQSMIDKLRKIVEKAKAQQERINQKSDTTTEDEQQQSTETTTSAYAKISPKVVAPHAHGISRQYASKVVEHQHVLPITGLHDGGNNSGEETEPSYTTQQPLTEEEPVPKGMVDNEAHSERSNNGFKFAMKKVGEISTSELLGQLNDELETVKETTTSVPATTTSLATTTEEEESTAAKIIESNDEEELDLFAESDEEAVCDAISCDFEKGDLCQWEASQDELSPSSPHYHRRHRKAHLIRRTWHNWQGRYLSFIRQKRADSEDAAVIDLDEPRSFDLEEDIYPLKTNNEIIVLNGPLKDENLQRLHLAINSATINFADVVKLLEKLKLSRKEVNYDSEEIKIQAKNGSFECLTEDMSCLLTIFLVVIQLSFLITCIIVVFLYARQLLRRADSSQREPLYSNYSVTNSSTDETEIEEIKS